MMPKDSLWPTVALLAVLCVDLIALFAFVLTRERRAIRQPGALPGVVRDGLAWTKARGL
jgi:hypothetical protein